MANTDRMVEETLRDFGAVHILLAINGTIVYLASDESSAVTGVTIPIDGGWCAW